MHYYSLRSEIKYIIPGLLYWVYKTNDMMVIIDFKLGSVVNRGHSCISNCHWIISIKHLNILKCLITDYTVPIGLKMLNDARVAILNKIK